jgi:aspartate aminotransferase-like enzyme
LKEGLPNIFARHARIADRARKWVKSKGMQLLSADERFASNTVTAVKAPESMDVSKFTSTLRDEFKVVIAGGQGGMKGKVFRIGHLGFINDKDMDEVISAMDKALPKAQK